MISYRQTLVIVAFVLCAFSVSATYTETNIEALFHDFKNTYGKKYATVEEEVLRFTYFKHNMAEAARHQARNPLATFGINRFSDITSDELAARHNGKSHYARRKVTHVPDVFTAAEAKAILASVGEKGVDWRAKGAVTPVVDQGQCGSSWVFSATGNIEGQWFLAGHKLTPVSVQEILACDDLDQGCSGGLMDNAFEWLIKNRTGIITTAAAYPYNISVFPYPTCTLVGHKEVGAVIVGYQDLPSNETQLAAWLAKNGPVAIAADASNWYAYTGGIMTDCVSDQMNHGALLVGFGTEQGTPYWIIKNQWGTTWGEQGYIRVQRGTNQCLLANAACTSKVKKAHTDV